MPNKNNTFVDSFETLCRTHFEFLVSEFGCTVQPVRSDNFGKLITFANGVVSVTFDYCPLDGCICITLYRLINGQLPKLGIFSNPKDELYSFRFDMLILLRTGRIVRQTRADLFNETRINDILSEYARLMKIYAAEFLRGDFRILPEIKAVIQQRARELQHEGFGPSGT
jgi:hypothetical protein